MHGGAPLLLGIFGYRVLPLSSPNSRFPSPPQLMSAATDVLPDLTHDEIRRYSRHLILDDIGMAGQQRLKASSVLCIGSGGLGSPALMYLAAAGVGTIGVVDDDVVDESNLQRQIVHSTSAVGESKVESARARVSQINPHVNLVMHKVHLTADNALDIMKPYDTILDGSDNFPTRYLVNDACVILGKPFVYGAVQKFEGQVSVFNYCGGPNYRDLFPDPPPPGAVPSCGGAGISASTPSCSQRGAVLARACLWQDLPPWAHPSVLPLTRPSACPLGAEGGILGVLPGVIGTMQATEAIKILLGKGETLSGRLLLWDAMRMSFREVKLLPRENAQPIESLIDYVGFCGQKPIEGATAVRKAPERFTRIAVAEADERLRSGWQPYVLDVRTKAEAAVVSLPFVDRQQPHRQMAHISSQLPRDRDILVHCKAGVRSESACESLSELGFDRLYSLEGGIMRWAQEIDPSMPTY